MPKRIHIPDRDGASCRSNHRITSAWLRWTKIHFMKGVITNLPALLPLAGPRLSLTRTAWAQLFFPNITVLILRNWWSARWLRWRICDLMKCINWCHSEHEPSTQAEPDCLYFSIRKIWPRQFIHGRRPLVGHATWQRTLYAICYTTRSPHLPLTPVQEEEYKEDSAGNRWLGRSIVPEKWFAGK